MTGETAIVTAADALERLREGNRRFVSGLVHANSRPAGFQAPESVDGQSPLAIVLGCSDSRVPAELVFDQGLGDLFVIRVAGNIVAPSQIGSVEFAASKFGTRLVVVLGHSHCGAVAATLDELRQPADIQSRDLRSIISRIQPAIEELMGASPNIDREMLIDSAIRSNVKQSVHQLRHGSSILENLIASQGLKIVGAEYSLYSGEVDFFLDS